MIERPIKGQQLVSVILKKPSKAQNGTADLVEISIVWQISNHAKEGTIHNFEILFIFFFRSSLRSSYFLIKKKWCHQQIHSSTANGLASLAMLTF